MSGMDKAEIVAIGSDNDHGRNNVLRAAASRSCCRIVPTIGFDADLTLYATNRTTIAAQESNQTNMTNFETLPPALCSNWYAAGVIRVNLEQLVEETERQKFKGRST
jgi:hypothetical protein